MREPQLKLWLRRATKVHNHRAGDGYPRSIEPRSVHVEFGGIRDLRSSRVIAIFSGARLEGPELEAGEP